MGWIEHSSGLAITRQCELAQVARATFYGRHPSCEHAEHELLLMRLIDEEYTRRRSTVVVEWWYSWGARGLRSTASGCSV